MLRVYDRLSRDGLLEMRQGQGTYVAGGASHHASRAHRGRLVEEFRQVARPGRALGLSDVLLHELLTEALEELGRQAAAEKLETTS